MKTEEEIKEMISMLESDISNYQTLHENGLKDIDRFPRYSGEFKQSIQIFQSQKQILNWVLGVDFG